MKIDFASILIVALFVLFVLLVIATPKSQSAEVFTSNLESFRGITRVVDTEAGVLCYLYPPGADTVGLISCLPLAQTKLDARCPR